MPALHTMQRLLYPLYLPCGAARMKQHCSCFTHSRIQQGPLDLKWYSLIRVSGEMSPFRLYDTLPFMICDDAIEDGCIVYGLHYLLGATIVPPVNHRYICSVL